MSLKQEISETKRELFKTTLNSDVIDIIVRYQYNLWYKSVFQFTDKEWYYVSILFSSDDYLECLQTIQKRIETIEDFIWEEEYLTEDEFVAYHKARWVLEYIDILTLYIEKGYIDFNDWKVLMVKFLRKLETIVTEDNHSEWVETNFLTLDWYFNFIRVIKYDSNKFF